MNIMHRISKSTQMALGINRVITYLIMADFFLISGWGLINPIFAVYITGQIKNAGIEAVGLATTIYFLLKSGLQIPLANIMDKIKGEKDDFQMMVAGMIIMGIVPLLYIFIRTVPQLFLVQALYGIGGALSYPSWLGLFTRHIDKNKEGWEWSLYYTTIDLSGAAAAAVGGYLAKYLGFQYLFLTISALVFIGILLSFKIRKNLRRS